MTPASFPRPKPAKQCAHDTRTLNNLLFHTELQNDKEDKNKISDARKSDTACGSERKTGLEPATLTLGRLCSTN